MNFNAMDIFELRQRTMMHVMVQSFRFLVILTKSTSFLSRYDRCNAITDNGTFDKGNNEATQKILLPFIIRCFEYFKENLPEEWAKGDHQGVIIINNSIHALIRTYNDIVNHLISQKKINPQNDNPDDIASEVEYYLAPLINYFSSITEEQRKEIRSNYGSGGKSKVWRKFEKTIADSRPDFHPDGLAQWIKDNTKQFNYGSLSMIHEIESVLKKDFAAKLEAEYGKKWITSGLPPKVYNQANTSMGKKNYGNSTNGISTEVSIWDCVTIANYRDIANFGPSWTELFEKKFTHPSELKLPGGKTAKTEWIIRLSKIASSTSSASYSVSEQDYLFLKSIYEWLVK